MMAKVRVSLLTGRYTAGPQIEWPPDPVRLFYAAVAVWGEAGSDPDERASLLWWENLDPPVIVSSGPDNVLIREDVGHYVPVNDVAVVRNLHGLGPRISDAEQRWRDATVPKERDKAAKALATLEKKAADDSAKAAQPRSGASTDITIMPDARSKQLRTYPTVRPDNPVIEYCWLDDDVPADLVGPLGGLVGRIGRLGHPSTLVHCELIVSGGDVGSDGSGADKGHVTTSTLVPDARGDRILRVPSAELLQELEMEFEIHRGRAPRSLPTGSAAYRWADECSPDEPEPLTWERSADQWLILELASGPASQRWDSQSLPTVNVSRTNELTRALRGALLRFCPEPIPPLLSGHRGDRPNDDPHALFLALPNAGHLRSDGSVSAVAVAIPAGSKPDDVGSIERAVMAWFESDQSGGELWFGRRRIRLNAPRMDSANADFDARRYTATRGYWARPSRTWTTATPVSLDRYPRALRGSGPTDFAALDAEVADLVNRACRFRGLPRPVSVRAISGSPMVGIPAVGGGGRTAFPPYRTEGSGQVRFTTHLQVSFDIPVRGPLVLGSGRHYGYGLFLPSDRRRAER